MRITIDIPDSLIPRLDEALKSYYNETDGTGLIKKACLRHLRSIVINYESDNEAEAVRQQKRAQAQQDFNF